MRFVLLRFQKARFLPVAVFLTCLLATLAIAGGGLEELEAGDVVVAMNFPDSSFEEVFRTLGTVGAFRITYENDVPTERIEMMLKKVTIREVLEVLASDHGLEYDVPESDHLVVRFPA